jgi:hypothetical protein
MRDEDNWDNDIYTYIYKSSYMIQRHDEITHLNNDNEILHFYMNEKRVNLRWRSNVRHQSYLQGHTRDPTDQL